MASGFSESGVGFYNQREHEFIRSVVIEIAHVIVADVSGKFARFPFYSKSDIVPDEGFKMSAVITPIAPHNSADRIVIFDKDHFLFFVFVQIGGEYSLLEVLAFKCVRVGLSGWVRPDFLIRWG